MDIIKKIEEDYLRAFKEKNELVILLLRQIKTALTNAEIAKNREALTEPEIIKLMQSEVKKRKDSAILYRQGNRPELAEREEKEAELLMNYLPQQLGEAEIKAKIAEVIAKTNAAGPGDMGKVIGAVMKELAGSADGNTVSGLVKEALNQ